MSILKVSKTTSPENCSDKIASHCSGQEILKYIKITLKIDFIRGPGPLSIFFRGARKFLARKFTETRIFLRTPRILPPPPPGKILYPPQSTTQRIVPHLVELLLVLHDEDPAVGDVEDVLAGLLTVRRVDSYSVMQSDGNSFCGDVVSDSFDKASRDEDIIWDQVYKSKYVRIF